MNSEFVFIAQQKIQNSNENYIRIKREKQHTDQVPLLLILFSAHKTGILHKTMLLSFQFEITQQTSSSLSFA